MAVTAGERAGSDTHSAIRFASHAGVASSLTWARM